MGTDPFIDSHPTDDPYIAVADALTPNIRKRALQAAVTMNRRLKGAKLPDILSLYDDGDALLEYVEPFGEQHGDALSEQKEYIRPALYAIYFLNQPFSLSKRNEKRIEKLAIAASNGWIEVMNGTHFLWLPCETTGKRRYDSQQKAERIMAQLLLHRPGQYPCRAYFCEHCKGWHLTSKPRRY